MNYGEAKQKRTELNAYMESQDNFFKGFGAMDTAVYEPGAISKKNKELMGLAISVVTRCNECINYHIGGCMDNGAEKAEIIEAVKIGVMAGGSITYPNARHAFNLLRELEG